MSDEPFESNGNEEKNQRDDDWENRILCRDENCIGVIGPDGRCKECGKPYEELQTPEAQTARPESEAVGDSKGSQEPVQEDDWESRTLCSDESCIGVIGPDGRCKECGKPYQR
jgi:hypothetical protein